MIRSLKWRIRWMFDKRWRASTRSRVSCERRTAEASGKPFKLTKLRKFVLDRPA